MKFLLLLIIVVLLVYGIKRIPGEIQRQMQKVLEETLTDLYVKDGYDIKDMHIDITKVEREPYCVAEGTYSGLFRCNFTDGASHIEFYGDFGFKSDITLSSVTDDDGNTFVAISIYGPYSVDSVRAKNMPDGCKYISANFINNFDFFK